MAKIVTDEVLKGIVAKIKALLLGKADSEHTHSTSDVENLQSILDNKYPKTGGTISGDITIQKFDNGKSDFIKNHSDTADYGTYLRDTNADGQSMGIVLQGGQTAPYLIDQDGNTAYLLNKNNAYWEMGLTVTGSEINNAIAKVNNGEFASSDELETLVSSKATKIVYTTTIPSMSWISETAGSSNYADVVGITANDTPIISPIYTGVLSTDKAILESWNKISRIVAEDNMLVFYCFEEIPDVEIPIQVEVIR